MDSKEHASRVDSMQEHIDICNIQYNGRQKKACSHTHMHNEVPLDQCYSPQSFLSDLLSLLLHLLYGISFMFSITLKVQYLNYIICSLMLTETLVGLRAQDFIQLAIACIFQNEVHSLLTVEVSIHTENIWMPENRIHVIFTTLILIIQGRLMTENTVT